MNRRYNPRRRNFRGYRGRQQQSDRQQPFNRSYEARAKSLQESSKAQSVSRKSKIYDYFHKFARRTSDIVGSPWAFTVAIITIIGWACLGPLFGYSDTWQLVINTATTIVTFIMVFLIQNTQNRDARAIHLKLDELLHAVKGARNRLIELEELSDEELDKLQLEFQRLRRKAPPAKCEQKTEHPE